jgi:methylated-DNA-[protein]-cysteine S-methyltransferase
MIHRRLHPTPLGPLLIEVANGGLRRIGFDPLPLDGPADEPANDRPAVDADAQRLLDAACDQLDAYFAGRRQVFDLPLAALGTPFQRRVWDALATIDYGRTCSYAQIAAQVGAPRAVRAVGAANARNPIGIVVPCHRVIGTNGRLTGYAGGLERKAQLLRLEGVALARA